MNTGNDSPQRHGDPTQAPSSWWIAMDRPKITVNSAIRAGVASPLSEGSAMPR